VRKAQAFRSCLCVCSEATDSRVNEMFQHDWILRPPSNAFRLSGILLRLHNMNKMTHKLEWRATVFIIYTSLLRPREQWRSIVVSTSACLSVCLSANISPEPHALCLPIFVCMLPMAVARSSSGRVTKSQGEGAIWGFSSSMTMHCNAFAANNVRLQKGSFRGYRSARHGRSVACRATC